MGQQVQAGRRHAGANVYPFVPRRERCEPSALQFAFRVDNFPHLAAAFGPSVAHQVVDATSRVLGGLFGDGGLVMRDGDGLISAFLWDASVLGRGSPDRTCARFVQAVAATLAARPIHVECQAVHVSVSGAWSTSAPRVREVVSTDRGGGVAAALSRVPFHGEAPGGQQWARRYRCDMADAVDLFDLLNEGRVLPAWQPVRNAEGAVLYYQCLLRAAGNEEDYASPPKLLPALERLGLVQSFDHRVVSQVVAELEAHPGATLGVSISALSAALDGWWVSTVERLRCRPDIARRLIVQLSGSAPFPSGPEVASFAAGLRKLGCRIAIEGFGAEHSTIQHLFSVKPDIVKVDPMFLQRAPLSDADRRAFHHVIGLASALAPTVVACGAKSAALVDVARAAGAAWLQGPAVGGVAVPRPWLIAPKRPPNSAEAHELRAGSKGHGVGLT